MEAWLGGAGLLFGMLVGWLLARGFPGRGGQGGVEMARRWALAERGVRTGELAAALAHEIKNPLNPIRGYARLLLSEVEAVRPSERALFEKGLGIIDAEAERIELRVRRALERSRSTAAESVDLLPLLDEVVGIVEVLPGVSRVEVHVPADLPRVRAVEDGLQGALVNLLENAAEAMRDRPGPVELSVSRHGTRVRVVIRDRGPGIGELSENEVMRSFFTTKENGTGLGLAVARSAVEASGGRIFLRNRLDGPGAEAELLLLVSQPAEGAAPAEGGGSA